MKALRGFRGRRGAILGVTAATALLAGSMTGPAQAAPPVAGECQDTLSAADATPGLIGEGLTVVKGKTPEPFRVEVLGVLDDGRGPDRDLIMVKVSDLPGGHVIDQGGGIWAGMSGSPVYVDGKLLGAVAYGWTLAPSPIGALTPASDMADLLDLGSGQARTAAKSTAAAAKTTVTLSAAARRQLGARAGVAVPSASMKRLPTPLAVSGLNGARLERLQKDVSSAGLPLRVHAAGRAVAPTAAPTARPVAGGNFAAMYSYGDLSVGGTGTTTYVCGDQALAFGHADRTAGPVRYGANDADVLTIIKDDTLGSFKMTNLAEPFGVVDQDRIAGVRADLTAVPTTTPITSTARNAETGRVRTGSTEVVDRTLLPELTPYALWANVDSTYDELGDGRLADGWTITGTRAGGKTFSVHRNDLWADREDATFYPVVSLADAVYALAENDDELVTITSVTYDATVSTTFRQLRLSKVEVSTNGGKTYSSPKSVKVTAGKKLTVRTTVKPYRGTTPTTKVTTLTVPKSAKGQRPTLVVAGGADFGSQDEADTECLFDDSCEEGEAPSLDTVIEDIESAPRNDDLVVALQTYTEDEESSDGKGSAKVLVESRVRQAEVVTGSRAIEVNVR